jgi:hypothetical protein
MAGGNFQMRDGRMHNLKWYTTGEVYLELKVLIGPSRSREFGNQVKEKGDRE